MPVLERFLVGKGLDVVGPPSGVSFFFFFFFFLVTLAMFSPRVNLLCQILSYDLPHKILDHRRKKEFARTMGTTLFWCTNGEQTFSVKFALEFIIQSFRVNFSS